MRNLATAQGINVSHRPRSTSELLLEDVRKHFREAIAQEKGRLARFVFQKSRGPSEPPVPEQCIAAADVMDIATLKRYRRQHEDLPSELRQAILYLGGGVTLNRQRLQAIAKTLGIYMQKVVRYPGSAKLRPPIRNLPEHLKHTMLTTTCIQRVQSWGATTLEDATRPSSI